MLATVALGWKILIIFVAGCAAGISNGIAGGGTFLSFPTLLAVGLPPLVANMSSSVGILPSTFGGIRGFREELRAHRSLLRSLVPTCVAGSVGGTAALLLGTNRTFSLVVPWLIGAATVLFAAAPQITKSLARRRAGGEAVVVHRRALVAGVLLCAAYGGYFGAGLGILLMAVLALTLPYELNVLQGLRVALSLLINTVAGVVFVARGHLSVQAVSVLLVGALVGGWLGTLLIRRLSPRVVRALVITIGAITTVKLALAL